MATPLHHSFRLSTESSRALHELTDRESLEYVMRETESLDVSLDIAASDDGSQVITIERGFVAEWPQWLAGLIGGTLTIREVRTWFPQTAAGVLLGRMEMTVPGQPVSMHATVEGRDDRDGCTFTIDGSIEARIPFLGGKVEAIVREQLLAAIDLEAQLLNNRN